MDVKTAIETADSEALRRLLGEDLSRADQLIRWGDPNICLTHPLHYISDLIFQRTLSKDSVILLVDVLIEAGADVDFQTVRDDGKKSDTPLIGAASLGAEEVGVRLIEAGARRELRGLFGETALHWAAMLGEDRLTAKLIEGVHPDLLTLKDEKYHSPPLGWAIHGWPTRRQETMDVSAG